MGLRKLLAVVGIVGCLTIIDQPTAHAQGSFAFSNELGYGGDPGSYATRYLTEEDARNGTNSGSTYLFPARDLYMDLYAGGSILYPGSDYVFLAMVREDFSPTDLAWPEGILQLVDFGGETDTSHRGYWLNHARTAFRYEVTGGPTDPSCFVGHCGLIWPQVGIEPTTDGVLGSFLNYTFSFTAYGLDPALADPDGDVWYISESRPTSLSGSFSGLFHYVDEADPSADGFYAFNVNINLENWAAENILGYDRYSAFASSDTVPEPATMTLLATGLAGLVGARRRKKS